MENFGSGIRRIYSLYSDFNKNPEIAATENSFKITLYNRNYHNRNYLLNQDNINEEMFVMINFLSTVQSAPIKNFKNM